MVDKIVELLQGLKEDVGGLREEVHDLSDKVDNLAESSSQDNSQYENIKHVEQVEQAVVTTTASKDEQSNYGRDLSRSEQEYLNELQAEDAQIKSDATLSDFAPTAPTSTIVQEDQIQNMKLQEKTVIEKFFTWITKDWPMKVGGFFVIAAIGWFVTYAAAEGWLSEAARVVLGYIASIAAVAFGTMRADKERTQGNSFLIIGVAAMLITTLAGIYYEVVTSVVGLFVMLISVGFVTLVSLKQRSINLTATMIFFGAIIPLFFVVGVTSNTIFVYLFILTLGTLWVVAFTSWRGLTTMMLTVVGFYSITYIADSGSVESVYNVIFCTLYSTSQ